MAVKLATRVTFEKGRKKSRVHILQTDRWREPADVAEWNLCGNNLCFCASEEFNVGVPPLLSVSVYPRGQLKTDRNTLRW